MNENKNLTTNISSDAITVKADGKLPDMLLIPHENCHEKFF